MNPNIRIKNGWLLQGMIDDYIAEIPDFKHVAPAPEEFKEKIEGYQRLWSEHEKKILDGIQELSGLRFNEKIIDVYVVHGFHRAFSDPLVMSSKYEGAEFVDVLTHEIIHRLFTDNTAGQDVSAWVRSRFPDVDDKKAIDHIMVHALHEAIYREVLDDERRLEADVIKSQRFPGYKLAWKKVAEAGCKNLLAEFRNQ
jgi:hypothetical protein